MVEYLLVPAAALALLALLGIQFLLQGVSYGPRSRRALALLTLPAAVAGAGAAAEAGGRPWVRVLVGLPVGGLTYLALACTAVLHWRARKVAALVGDVRALRRRLAERRREVDRLLWQTGGPAAVRVPAPVGGGPPPADPAVWGAAVDRWVQARPDQAAARRAQIDAWQAELRRCSRAELAARARVLEAAWRDAPGEEEALALRARLGALWLVYGELPSEAVEAGQGAGAAGRLAVARQELARLQEELTRLLRQRAELLRRRLPLD
jgi:hypothetical protein